jgi:hypothetical protein
MAELEFSSEKDTVFIDFYGVKEPFAKIVRPQCLDSEKSHYAELIAEQMNKKYKSKE